MKQCPRCERELELSNFYKRNDRTKRGLGVSSYCKECVKRDKSIYREDHKELIKEKSFKWRKSNKDKISLQNQKSYQLHRVERLASQKLYVSQNRNKVAKYRREYERKRKAIDPAYRIGRNLRGRIAQELRKHVGGVKTHKIKYIGCSLGELKQHIEGQFLNGMSWDNYGHTGWHIDHIKPVSLFNVENEVERFVAFNYKNLQPLWARDNLVKGNKYG